MQSLLDNPKFAQVVSHFEQACAASRAHSELTEHALNVFGQQGSLIAGVVRDHFPDYVKDRLRTLARLVTTESDAAYTARPKRVRLTTIRAIGSQVAKRDGSGFYGPQG